MSVGEMMEYYLRQHVEGLKAISLLLTEQPKSVPERAYTFKMHERGKQTVLLSFIRWLDFEREGEGFKYFHVYSLDVIIKRPGKKVGFSIVVRDYEKTGISWFDEPVEKVVETVKEKGLETVMNMVFEDLMAFVFSRLSSVVEDLK
jgi:hypothetical protein